MAQGDLLGAVMQSDIGAAGAAGVANWDATTPRNGKGINLLDNWYFVGGGTDGKFPVNQRGVFSYTTGDSFIIDRWYIYSGSSVAIPDAAGVVITGGMTQQLEMDRIDAGKVYTLSVLYADNTFYSKSGAVSDSWAWQLIDTTGGAAQGQSGIGIHTNNAKWQVAIWNNVANRRVVAAKLELGSEQTLARQVNGTWVLNDPAPNYQQELAKCRRYLQVITGSSLGSNGNDVGLGVAYDAHNLVLPIPTTILLNDSTTLSASSQNCLKISTSSLSSGVDSTSVGISTMNYGFNISVNIYTTSSLTAGTVYRVALKPNSSLYISSELL